jgi:hypothetical protein
MTVPRRAVHGEVFFKAISNLLQVKMLEGLERWLHSMNDATASDVIAGESPAEAPPPSALVRTSVWSDLIDHRGVALEHAIGALCGTDRAGSRAAHIGRRDRRGGEGRADERVGCSCLRDFVGLNQFVQFWLTDQEKLIVPIHAKVKVYYEQLDLN